nr:hypothetical protein [Candidatus Sigynarchaeum springense]
MSALTGVNHARISLAYDRNLGPIDDDEALLACLCKSHYAMNKKHYETMNKLFITGIVLLSIGAGLTVVFSALVPFFTSLHFISICLLGVGVLLLVLRFSLLPPKLLNFARIHLPLVLSPFTQGRALVFDPSTLFGAKQITQMAIHFNLLLQAFNSFPVKEFKPENELATTEQLDTARILVSNSVFHEPINVNLVPADLAFVPDLVALIQVALNQIPDEVLQYKLSLDQVSKITTVMQDWEAYAYVCIDFLEKFKQKATEWKDFFTKMLNANIQNHKEDVYKIKKQISDTFEEIHTYVFEPIITRLDRENAATMLTLDVNNELYKLLKRDEFNDKISTLDLQRRTAQLASESERQRLAASASQESGNLASSRESQIHHKISSENELRIQKSKLSDVDRKINSKKASLRFAGKDPAKAAMLQSEINSLISEASSIKQDIQRLESEISKAEREISAIDDSMIRLQQSHEQQQRAMQSRQDSLHRELSSTELRQKTELERRVAEYNNFIKMKLQEFDMFMLEVVGENAGHKTRVDNMLKALDKELERHIDPFLTRRNAIELAYDSLCSSLERAQLNFREIIRRIGMFTLNNGDGTTPKIVYLPVTVYENKNGVHTCLVQRFSDTPSRAGLMLPVADFAQLFSDNLASLENFFAFNINAYSQELTPPHLSKQRIESIVASRGRALTSNKLVSPLVLKDLVRICK